MVQYYLAHSCLVYSNRAHSYPDQSYWNHSCLVLSHQAHSRILVWSFLFLEPWEPGSCLAFSGSEAIIEIHCTLYTFQFAVYSIQSLKSTPTVYSVHYTVCNLKTLQIRDCIKYTVYCKVYSLQTADCLLCRLAQMVQISTTKTI